MTKIFLFICCAVFCISAYKLYEVYSIYTTGDAENENIAVNVVAVEPEDTDTYWKYNIDFDQLKRINNDVIGWIRFEQPEIINYAILQSTDNSYYLDKTVEKNTSIFGSIFMDCYNDSSFTDSNTILYGHNMKNGSMFGSLKNYKEKDYYLENPYFYIYTADGMAAKYEIFAVQQVKYDSWHYTKYFNTIKDFADYIEDVVLKSYYATGVEVRMPANIITLSTCTANDDYRMIVQAVRQEEHAIE